MRNNISFNNYKDVLFSGKEVLRTMNVIRSRQHNLSTEQVNKIALSSSDEKRTIRPDKIKTLAHGYRAGWHGKSTWEPTGRQGNRQADMRGLAKWQGGDRMTGVAAGWQGWRQGDRSGDGMTGEAWQSGAKWTNVLYLAVSWFSSRVLPTTGNKVLTKNLLQQFFKLKTFTPSSTKNIRTSLLYDVFNWVTPGQNTTSCLQLFGNFIMMQRSCFK